MSLFERAFSFLNCTRCGKLFGYNEKVLSCENRWNRNCFDYEAVCGKCMHDHAASIHVTDKQRYITEFVARRHDIEEKIRDFINKMKTKFFDGTIDCVMPEAETSKAEPSKAETSKAERSKAEPVVVPSEVAASAHDEEEDNDESNTDEEEDDDDESTYCAETQSYSGPVSYLEKVKPWIAADKARSLPDDEIREDFDDDFAEVVERKKAELLQLRSFNDVTSSSGLKIAQPESTFGTSTTSVESVHEKEVVAEEPKMRFPMSQLLEKMNADLLQHLSHFNEVASSSGLKIAQPESTLGTSTTIVAVESIPEKEVVAEEPKKLGFPGIDLKTWEATEWPIIQKRQQEAMAQKRQVEDMTLLQEKLTKSQAEKDEKPKETKFPGIDLKTWEETEWPIIQKRQQQEAMTRILEKLAKSQAEKAVTMEKQEALAKSQAEKDEKPQEMKFSGIDLKIWEATEWSIIQKRQQEAMAQLVQKRQEGDMTLLQEKFTKSQAEKDEKPKETKFPGIDLKVWEATEWPIIKKRQEEEAKQQQMQEQDDNINNDNVSVHSAPPLTPNIEWPLEEEEDNNVNVATASIDPSAATCTEDEADNVSVQTAIEIPQTVLTMPVDMRKLKRGDLIIAQWDAAHDAYSVPSFGSRKYFVNEESLKENQIPRYLRCFHATVQRIDLCRVRKVENRYRLPVGTEICRIHLTPASAQSVFDGAVSQ